MIFFCCLAVLPTCYLIFDSHLFGLTLRPSAPVCCCHRVSWARGRLAFAQEAVRVSSSLSPLLVLHVMARARWSVSNFSSSGVENFEGFCNYVKLFSGFFHIPSVCTVIDHLLWVRYRVLRKHYVLLR